MEPEKTEEKKEAETTERYHHHGPIKMLLGIVFVLLIAGLAFGAGRISSRNAYGRGLGRMMGGVGTISTNRNSSSTLSGRGMMGGRTGNLNSERISGQISSINGTTIVVKDGAGTEYTVNIADTTSIIISGKIDKLSNLKTSDQVAITGLSKSDGSINATLIRTI